MVRIIDNYTLYQCIGEGSYGKVYRAINKLDRKQYAVKVIEAKKFQTDRKLQEYTVNQINILSNIEKNQHIIGYYQMLKSQNNFYFVYQYCNQGTLQDLLNRDGKLKQNQALLIFKDLLCAFKLLYRCHVMHRDLKPDNIFFKDGLAKVGDFGFCKNLEKTKVTDTMLGSPVYMAPQVLKGQPYSNKADIWSLGVVLYQMLYGYCPFESTSISKLIQTYNTCQVGFPDNVVVSPNLKNLMKKILTKCPNKRIQWQQLFNININPQGVLLQEKKRLPFIPIKIKQQKQKQKQQQTKQKKRKNSGNDCLEHHLIKRQRTQSLLRPTMHHNHNVIQKIIPKKINAIQQQTDDQSTKAKFIRRQKTYTKFRPFERSQNIKQIDMQSKHISLKKVIPKQGNLKFLGNKAILTQKHRQILQGINIAKNLADISQKYTNLFTIFLLQQVIKRLNQLFKEIKNQKNMDQLQQIIQIQLEQFNNKFNNIQQQSPTNAELLNQHKQQWKQLFSQRIQQCRNPRLCYQMVMYLLEQKPVYGLSNNEMREIILTKLN